MVISKKVLENINSKPTKWAGDINFVKLKVFELSQMYPNKNFTFIKLATNKFHVYEMFDKPSFEFDKLSHKPHKPSHTWPF